MRYRYYTCDVFTDVRFGGNPLAVLPEAEGLRDTEMQQIAREFNFSETAFVFPAEAGNHRRVRIFTPTTEVPFAGHPNVGTAFVLAGSGAFGPLDSPITVTFEEPAGLVPIAIERRATGRIWCELRAPERLSLGVVVPPPVVAAAISLAPAEIVTAAHQPQTASVGLPFLIAELRDWDALKRARPNIAGFEQLIAHGARPDLHLYVRTTDRFDLRVRMFCPFDGVPEDPATGSANCALAALLTHLNAAAEGQFTWRIAQGVEMGRPSLLEARTEKRGGEVVNVWIGGESVLVSEGMIEV